jgi:hypothetical protein
MKRFEYMHWRPPMDWAWEQAVEQLNKFGSEGWECISDKGGFLFKRRIIK